MKKTASPTPATAVILSFPIKRHDLTLEKFEVRADAFLRSRITAHEFLETCDEALKYVGTYEYKKNIYKYRYLALMDLGRTYEATADAYVMLDVFDDPPLHYEMMCTISLVRKNYDRALRYIDQLTSCKEYGISATEYSFEKERLIRYLQKVQRFSALEICMVFTDGEEAAKARFSGIPLIISGRPELAIHSETQNHYLIYSCESSMRYSIYCSIADNEVPFLNDMTSMDRQIAVSARLLGADNNKILMKPCYLVD